MAILITKFQDQQVAPFFRMVVKSGNVVTYWCNAVDFAHTSLRWKWKDDPTDKDTSEFRARVLMKAIYN